VTMTGKQEVRAVKIDPDAADPSDMGVLEDLVMVAVNDAIQKSQELAATRLSAVTGGMKIPGLM
jgi:nucleoid-associated protein EbfC